MKSVRNGMEYLLVVESGYSQYSRHGKRNEECLFLSQRPFFISSHLRGSEIQASITNQKLGCK